MFPEGQRVEVTEGAFAGTVGIVITHDEAVQRYAQAAAEKGNSDPIDGIPGDLVCIVVTFWGRPLVLTLPPWLLRAVAETPS